MRKKNIVCIDDEPDLLDVYKLYLEPRYIVEVFSSPQDGLDHITKGNPCDLIILDIFMPELDGLKVLVELSKYSSTIPVLMCTGGGESSDNLIRVITAGTSIELGATEVLFKPFDELELRKIVYDTLKKTK